MADIEYDLILPVHPDTCTVCHGLDWDIENDVPCQDKSWCQVYKKHEFGYYVCSLPIDHKGKHKTGKFEW